MREILLLQVAANNYNQKPRSDLGPGSRTWSFSMRMIGEAGQELGEGKGGLSLLASPENLSPWPPLSPRLYCVATSGTLRLQLLGKQSEDT